MPRENSARVASFNTIKHLIENRSARHFCRLFLDEFLSYGEGLALGKLPQFMQLGIDGQHLLVLDVRGFAGVDKVFWHEGYYRRPLALTPRAKLPLKRATGL